MNNLPNTSVPIFFELIQVSLGVRPALSYSPSKEEWKMLYHMAGKQSITGICFLGVQTLSKQCPKQIQELPMGLRMRWLAAASEIQRQNEMMDMRCAELCGILEKDGLQVCILKGQGVANLYRSWNDTEDKSLGRLRQIGDIDVWVKDTDIPRLVHYIRSRGLEYKATATHVECDFFPRVAVELHAEPALFRNIYYSRRLQQWCKAYDWHDFYSVKDYIVPSDSFNLIFLLVHMYQHFLHKGVGFRQMMDYLMLLYSLPVGKRQMLYEEAMHTLKSLGMQRFTQGLMYVMQEVFMLPRAMMLCEPRQKVGEIIMSDMLECGNMGKFRGNKTSKCNCLLGRYWTSFKRSLVFLSISPSEILSSPIWSLWHWGWRKWRIRE